MSDMSAGVPTNNVELIAAVEETPGVLPASPLWQQIQPSSIDKMASDLTTVTRDTISKNRQLEKGAVVDKNSGSEFGAELTMDFALQFLEGFTWARMTTGILHWRPSAVTSTGYTVAADGDIPQNTLVYARGFANTENNGLKVVGASSTETEVKTSGLVAEGSPPSNAEVWVCGFRATTGDLEIDSAGDLISTSLDFTTLGLTVGQSVWIGGAATANKFATAGNYGGARVRIIAANKLTIEKTNAAFAEDEGAGKNIDLLFGNFIRNVAVDHSDSVERTFQIEAAYPNMDDGAGGTVTKYEYSIGNYPNVLELDFQTKSLVTSKISFLALDTDAMTTSRKTNAASALSPLKATAMNASSDFARIRLAKTDETGITTYIKSMNLKLDNGMQSEGALGQLGAVRVSPGNFTVSLDALVYFSHSEVVDAVVDNETLSMDFIMKNEDGGLAIDIPSMVIGSDARNFEKGMTVKVPLKGTAFRDEFYNFSVGFTYFPYLP
jgi:hypothetical protein